MYPSLEESVGISDISQSGGESVGISDESQSGRESWNQ